MLLGIYIYCKGIVDVFSSPVNQSHQTLPCKGAEQLHTSTACRVAGELWGGEGQGFFLTRRSSCTGRIAEQPVKPAVGWSMVWLDRAYVTVCHYSTVLWTWGFCTDLYTHRKHPENSIIRTLLPFRKREKKRGMTGLRHALSRQTYGKKIEECLMGCYRTLWSSGQHSYFTVLGSNLDQEINYLPTKVFRGLIQSLQVNSGTVPHIMPQLILSTFSPCIIHSSFCYLALHNLSMSLNTPYISK